MWLCRIYGLLLQIVNFKNKVRRKICLLNLSCIFPPSGLAVEQEVEAGVVGGPQRGGAEAETRRGAANQNPATAPRGRAAAQEGWFRFYSFVLKL